jgi:hypothetical protein
VKVFLCLLQQRDLASLRAVRYHRGVGLSAVSSSRDSENHTAQQTDSLVPTNTMTGHPYAPPDRHKGLHRIAKRITKIRLSEISLGMTNHEKLGQALEPNFAAGVLQTLTSTVQVTCTSPI